jgi:hypothetical protein
MTTAAVAKKYYKKEDDSVQTKNWKGRIEVEGITG